MSREVFGLIALVATATTLIPLICLLIYRKRQPKQHLILGFSLIISLAFDVINSTLAYHQITNIVPNNIYRIVAFPAIMWFYHETLIRRPSKILVRIFTVAFLVLALIFGLDQGLNVMNHNTWTLSSILITITSFLFVGDLNLMDESTFVKNRYHETNILLNTSLALYYFATIILFALSDYVFSHFTPEDVRYFWTFHNVLHISKNIGIAIAFYLCATRNNSMANIQDS